MDSGEIRAGSSTQTTTELLQNKFKAKDGQQIEQLPQLTIRDAVDEIGEVVSEEGEKKVFDFLDKYKQKNLKDISDLENISNH